MNEIFRYKSSFPIRRKTHHIRSIRRTGKTLIRMNPIMTIISAKNQETELKWSVLRTHRTFFNLGRLL